MAALATDAVQKWLDVIAGYKAEFTKWDARVVKIVKKFRDDTGPSASANESAKFNILWSNVQTLVPAVFAKLPTADVARRFGDDDPVGRVASLLLTRALDFEIEHYPDFRASTHNAVQDRFLGGRGVGWVRYEPHTRKQPALEITDTPEVEESTADVTAGQEQPEEIAYECAPIDYVHWKDFGHSRARTWEEVTAVWRWVYLSKSAAEARFGAKTAEKLTYGSNPESGDGKTKAKGADKAKIAEIWDRDSRCVYWISADCPDLLDDRDDPLELDGFFPCAKPLYATLTSDSLVPVPDFVLYQDQANELDILTDRIDGLVKALRVRGVYDASQPALQRLLTEGDNNTLIPVDKWMALSEKGGLKGSIDILPIQDIANALIQCYQAQAQIKGQIYEITGISDIIRGQTAASETATAQQIKGQYAGLRLRSMQEAVALFASELLRLKAQIICSKYQDETILAYAAASQMHPADQQLIPQAMQLLRDTPLRSFRVEVDADSLVQLDENQVKQDRVEFLNALSNFMREALPVGQQTPELVPMLMSVMKFGISGFKAAREIEGTIDLALQQLVQKAAQAAQNPQPHPEQVKAQAQAQADQAKTAAQGQIEQMKAQAGLQVEQLKAQTGLQIEQIKAQSEGQRQLHEGRLKMSEQASREGMERWKAQLDAATKITVARISAAAGGQDPDQAQAEGAAAQQLIMDLAGEAQKLGQHMATMHGNMVDMHSEAMSAHQAAQKAATVPKRIIRGPDGRATGIEPVAQPQAANGR